ncbi:hypothetical protein BSKO_11626 [Bryopsis sp. KO-2023]|nr:hypothetical protein BSKO_11626 [Bryopsis sp. KO-2023]
MDKGLTWLKNYISKQKHATSNNRSDSDVSSMLFDLFHDSCVPQWQEVLGTGTVGGVCKGYYKDMGGGIHDVAIKCCSFLSGEEAIEVVELEMQAYQRFRNVQHPNIVRCLGGNLGEGRTFPEGAIMMQVHIDGLQYFKLEELMAMNLSQLIHEDKDFSKDCTYQNLVHIFWGIALGLEFLHDHDIVHHDLKSSNVLVDSRGKQVKLSDFGSSKIRMQRCWTVQSKGTPGYVAPETCLKTSPGQEASAMQSADIYSLGVIMWECVTRCSPWQIDRTLTDVDGEWEFAAIADTYFYTNVLCPIELRNLIASCLQFSMTGCKANVSRPSAHEVRKQLERMLDAPWAGTRPIWSNHLPGTRVGLTPTALVAALLNSNLDLDLDAQVNPSATLGMSSFSRVAAGEYEAKSGELHDVLVIYYSSSGLDRQAKELLLFGSLPEHDNIVKCFGGRLGVEEGEPGDAFVIVQRLTCDLDSFLWRRKGSLHFQPGRADYHILLAEIWLGIASGLEHLHKNGIVYQNLNPRNVFLDFNTRGGLSTVKLGSLQHAERVVNNVFHLNPVPNLGFMAPETIHSMHSRNVALSMAMDVYSLGMLMWHCVEEDADQINDPSRGFLQPRLGALPILLLGLVSDCTKPRPEDRPTCADVVDRLNDFLASNYRLLPGNSFRLQNPTE